MTTLHEAQPTVGRGGPEEVDAEGGGEPASTVDIRLLGPLRVITPSMHLTGRDFPSGKARQVCAALAVASGKPVS